jgi:hypothetical protein
MVEKTRTSDGFVVDWTVKKDVLEVLANLSIT